MGELFRLKPPAYATAIHADDNRRFYKNGYYECLADQLKIGLKYHLLQRSHTDAQHLIRASQNFKV